MAQEYSNDIFIISSPRPDSFQFKVDLGRALSKAGFNIVQSGAEYSRYAFDAIEKTRLSIVVLSENYAESPWLLQHLIKILDCKKSFDQRVLPIFYKVNPTDVKYQQNNCTFAMERLELTYGKSPEVKKWRSALHQISEFKNGKCYTADRNQREFIQEIVEMTYGHFNFLSTPISAKSSGQLSSEHIDFLSTPISAKSSGQLSFTSYGITSLQSFPTGTGNEYYFNSIKEASKNLLDALQDDSCYTIGLCGRRGSGKTVLVKAELSWYGKFFDRVIFPNVSKNQDIKSIQDAIANSLNVYFEKNDRDAVRIMKMFSKIERMDGTTLVILDDFPREYTPQELGIPYNNKHCKVILTTRDELDCPSMGCNLSIPLQPLSNDEAWTLLQHLSGVNSQLDLLDVARKVAFKCNGLPGLIKDVSSSLKKKLNIDQWRESLISLSHSTARYQIFISFRGETRHVFTKHLYDALCQEGFKTFMDDKSLEGGVPIEKLLDDIEESRFSIVILSPNFADSEWCLRELVQILDCKDKEEKKQLVLPIFYDVEPGHVKYLQNTFGEAMAKHEKKFEQHPEILQKWKNALRDICKLTGFKKPDDGARDEFIKRIVRFSCENRHRLHIQSMYMN